jgi:hypothetical protein
MGWWLGFGLALTATCASLFVLFGMGAVFMKPHAFGARDGQGAAGLAALILLVGAGASPVSSVVLAIVAAKLRKRFDVRWAWPGRAWNSGRHRRRGRPPGHGRLNAQESRDRAWW